VLGDHVAQKGSLGGARGGCRFDFSHPKPDECGPKSSGSRTIANDVVIQNSPVTNAGRSDGCRLTRSRPAPGGAGLFGGEIR